MKLLFKQRFFSWLDSYDIFNEHGETVYTVRGELAWAHRLKIYDGTGRELGTVQQKIFTWLPQFELYEGQQHIGSIRKELTFFKPKYQIDCNGWQVDGDWFEWDYTITAADGTLVARIQKEVWNWTDTYSIDVEQPQDALRALMLVLAIDAEKCSRIND